MGSQPVKPLSESLPPLILGGAGFSYQCHPDPEKLPISDVIKQAFDHGMQAIDTSPYYEPSEQLLGQALQDTRITNRYTRSDYVLMTKVGRIKADEFNYTPEWVRHSVNRSLERLHTSYLDVVFCHDVEYVEDEDVLGAVGELLNFVREGKVRYIGISSYRIDILSHLANLVRQRHGRPVDVVQNWGQLNLQNRRLEEGGLKGFEDAGVKVVLNASPLNIGLLRAEGVPVGKLGDFHPAPAGLRQAVKDVADYVGEQGENLAALAMRFCMWRAEEASHSSFRVATISGISTVAQLAENVGTAVKILEPLKDSASIVKTRLNEKQVLRDRPLVDKVQDMLRECGWLDYSIDSPDPRWSRKLKRMISEESNSA